jgi:hypothetical protein
MTMSLIDDDPYTLELRLCDDAGYISGEQVEDFAVPPGGETYLQRLNRLKALGGDRPWEGAPFPCTGHAHLAHQHIRCTSKAHAPGPDSQVVVTTHPQPQTFAAGSVPDSVTLTRGPGGCGWTPILPPNTAGA